MDLLYKEEVYAIVGAALEVYNELGNGYLEAVYQEAMEIELAARGIPFQPRRELVLFYKGVQLKKTYVCDLLCHDKIIVELKAARALTGVDDAQLLNYLKATGQRLGLLFNFGEDSQLTWKRLIH